MKKKVILFNTYDTVIPVMKGVVEALDGDQVYCRGLITNRDYRTTSQRSDHFIYINFPGVIRNSKLLSILFYSLYTSWYVLTKRISLAILFTQPPLLHLILGFLLKFRKVPYVLHVMDMYPEVLVELGYLKKGGWPANLLNKLSSKAHNNAQKVVSIGRCMTDRLKLIGVQGDNINLIEVLAFDQTPFLDFGKTPDPNLSAKYHFLDGKLVITYAGNMGMIHTFHEVLSCMKMIKEKNLDEQVVFVFIGGGARKKGILDFVKEEKISNFHFFEPMDPNSSDFKYLLYRAHFHLITVEQGFTGVAVPSKFYAALYSGSSVIFIGDQNCEVAQVVNNLGFGITTENGGVSELFEKIEKVVVSGNFPELRDHSLIDFYMNNYHTDRFKVKYKKMIDYLEF